MKPSAHVTLGGGAALILWPVIGLNAVYFFLASVFIDLDHYLDFVYHNGFRDLSPMKMFRYHSVITRYWRDPAFISLEVFHSLEFVFLLFGVWIYLGSNIMEAVLLGILFHIATDTFYMFFKKILFIRSFSIIGHFIGVRSMKRRGIDPARVYNEVIGIVLNGGGKAAPLIPFLKKGKE